MEGESVKKVAENEMTSKSAALHAEEKVRICYDLHALNNCLYRFV